MIARQNKLPNLLIEIVEFLKRQDLKLDKLTPDGRTNSALYENEILERLVKPNFEIADLPKPRDWFDFSFNEDGIFYPVNIKVSTTKTYDNLNCKLGIYYALTGKDPTFNNEINLDNYFKFLSEDIESNDSDYYFLIINKDNPSDVFATSLKCLETIIPNGNNLPFQAKWDDNRNMIQREFTEVKEFLLGTFKQSLKLRADAYLYFNKYFSNILSGNKNTTIQQTFQSHPDYPNPCFDFYIECDYCKKQNHCYLSHTINGNIITHCRCNKE